jgi:hypothetical protein
MTTLESHLAPILDRAAKQLAADIVPVVRAAVRESLQAALSALEDAPVPRVRRKARRRAQRKPRAVVVKAKRVERVVQRDPRPAKLSPVPVGERRPCGCAARGRHASTCTAGSPSSSKSPTLSVAPSAPVPKVPVDASRASRFAAIEEAARRRQNGARA